jgi:hypothetical protein
MAPNAYFSPVGELLPYDWKIKPDSDPFHAHILCRRIIEIVTYFSQVRLDLTASHTGVHPRFPCINICWSVNSNIMQV